MTQKSCAVGMRNAKLGNHLKFHPLSQQGRLLSAHARESKKLFLLCHFRECIAGARGIRSAEFNTRTFEGESFFNKSSVSHLKHVTAKSNSKWRENCSFHIACSDFTGDKALFVHTCHRQRWWISLQQRWSKASVNSFLHHSEGATGLIRRQPKGKWLLW